jgi:hypothetical protein
VDIALWVMVLVEFAGLVALGVLLLVSRRRLAAARRQLERRRRDGESRRRRRKPMGVAPLAIRTVANTVQTADSIIRRQIGGSVRSSIEDLAAGSSQSGGRSYGGAPTPLTMSWPDGIFSTSRTAALRFPIHSCAGLPAWTSSGAP